MEDKVARLIECERIIRQTEAEQLGLIADLNTDEWSAIDFAMALQLSPVAAAHKAEWATRLATVFPDVLEAMAAGVISERGAHAIVDPTEHYSPEVAQKAVAKTLEAAGGRTPQQLRRSSQARPSRAAPVEHARRREERVKDR